MKWVFVVKVLLLSVVSIRTKMVSQKEVGHLMGFKLITPEFEWALI